MVERSVGASLRWWEQAFLVALELLVVEQLVAHSAQTLGVERLAGVLVAMSLVVGPLEAHLEQTLEVERLVGGSVVVLWVVEPQVAKSG